jgi:drug/metabolite transporter (DMT)-like permease
MYNYPIFLNVLTTAFYVPISFMYIIPMIHYGTAITPEQIAVPKYKFLVMGCLDCVASAMSMFATNYIVSGSEISLIQQSAIPISMGLSKFILGAKYSPSQYIGAVMVCAGIVVVLTPPKPAPGSSSSGGDDPSAAGGDEGNGHNQILWAVVMMVSCVPSVLSSVYKEMALQGQDIDVIYLNGWVAIFQFLLCLPLAYPSAYATALPIDELWPNMYDGMWCFLGYNSVHPDGTVDDCGNAPLFVSFYMLFNLSYNVLIILILKHGSANIMFMGSTALVPLTNALFACPFIPGHKPLKTSDFIGLGVIMSGITVYRFVTRLPCAFLDSGEGRGDEDDDESDEDTGDAEANNNSTAANEKPARAAKRKDGVYFGLNAMAAETIQPLLSTRVILAKARHARRTRLPDRDTRSPYLSRLGIAPSPRVGASPRFSPGPRTRIAPQPGYNPLGSMNNSSNSRRPAGSAVRKAERKGTALV